MPIRPRRRGALFRIPWYFVESGGHLHLIVIDRHSLMEFDIWELKKNYSGWFVRYLVNLCEEFESFSIVCVARAEKEKESSLVLLVAEMDFLMVFCTSGGCALGHVQCKTARPQEHGHKST